MAEATPACSRCGEKALIKGDIGLRTSKDLELIMVVRRAHGVEKKVPIHPKVCGKCGFVDFFVHDPEKLKIRSSDKSKESDLKQRPILEYDF